MKFLPIIFVLNILTAFGQSWVQYDDYPGNPIDDGCVFVIGNKAYCGSGLTPWWSAERDFYAYDMSNDTWSSIDSLPIGQGRQYATAFSDGVNGFVFGGYNGSSFLNDLLMYDPILDQWSTMTSLPGAGRSGSACFVLGDTAYIIGGKTAVDFAIDEVWAYDMSANSWSQKSALPFGTRWRSSATAHDTYGYLAHGRDSTDFFHNSFHRYDPVNDSWASLSPFPGLGRSHASMGVVKDSIYFLFGLDSNLTSHADVHYFDIGDSTWSSDPWIAVGRRGGMTFSSTAIYYTTGINENDIRLNETWKLDPDVGIEELQIGKKKLIRITDAMGRIADFKANTLLIYIYDDGTSERVFKME